MDLKSFREIIREKPLLENEVNKNPFEFLQEWIQEAIDAGIRQPNAMNVATIDEQGHPQSRVVLLKEIKGGKLTFFTNYNSPKSKEIDKNNHIALNFLWFDINRQVRINGVASKTSGEYSESYFRTRPRDSQIAAIISDQSKVIEGRNELEELYNKYNAEFEDKEIPFPNFWGGYEVEVNEFEFWQGRVGRLHDRLKFFNNSKGWSIKRLNP